MCASRCAGISCSVARGELQLRCCCFRTLVLRFQGSGSGEPYAGIVPLYQPGRYKRGAALGEQN